MSWPQERRLSVSITVSFKVILLRLINHFQCKRVPYYIIYTVTQKVITLSVLEYYIIQPGTELQELPGLMPGITAEGAGKHGHMETPFLSDATGRWTLGQCQEEGTHITLLRLPNPIL